MSKLIGVSQSDYGHEYRWVFEEKSLRRQLKKYGLDADDYISEDGYSADIGFPIGGSNSSSTYFCVLNSDNDVRAFLEAALMNDSADPTLCDCGECCLTIDTDDDYYGAVTSKYVKKFGIDLDAINDSTDEYYDIIEQIADYFEEIDYDDFDYDDPFYGDDSDMTVSELIELYHEVDPDNTLGL